MGPTFTFELPAIEALDGGYANLADGWQVPLRRRHRPLGAATSPAESFSEFLRLAGDEHTSLYDLGAASSSPSSAEPAQPVATRALAGAAVRAW